MSEAADLEDVKRKFAAFRERSRRDIESARNKGRDDATVPLLDIIDDCDRALRVMDDTEDIQRMVTGVEQLRRRTLHHFRSLGYQPFGEQGDMFDPVMHEAVSVEPGVGPDGSLLRIHRRGWMRDGEVIRPAMVTVLQGSLEPPFPETDEASRVAETRRARHRNQQAEYQCPYNIPGCIGDCPGCAILPPDEDEIPNLVIRRGGNH